jgi:hypothetical protein
MTGDREFSVTFLFLGFLIVIFFVVSYCESVNGKFPVKSLAAATNEEVKPTNVVRYGGDGWSGK